MLSIETYKKDPCGSLSIPYWKAQITPLPPGMKIMHDRAWHTGMLHQYSDRKFFRLSHALKNIPAFSVSGVSLETIRPGQTQMLADMINRSYTHSGIAVSADFIEELTQTPVYCPALWFGAFAGENLVGSILCDYDAQVGEAVIEWLQVLPEYRRRGIASALVCKALDAMRGLAEFATVSGECDNITAPEKVYRKCGFEGNDIWHILSQKS